MLDFNKATLSELKEAAKALGIKSVSKYKKAELIELIQSEAESNKQKTPSRKTACIKKKVQKIKAESEPQGVNEENSADLPEQTDTPSETEEKETQEKKDGFEAAGDCEGVLEVLSEGYGFLRCENYLTGSDDVYVSNVYIRKFGLKTGDLIKGKTKQPREGEKFRALIYINEVNGDNIGVCMHRTPFEKLTPIYPNERLYLESDVGGADDTVRLLDLIAPIGKGQRGLIVAPPKAGKTTFLKNLANSITENNDNIKLIVLLIDERPEEVTDMQRSVKGEVIYSTFDEMPEHHTRVAEMVLERAQRLCEHKQDVVIIMDSITRLARAYNLTIPSSGRTLSGGIDPAALYKPKHFFGSARNIEEGGSITIIASALVDTGSRMDDVIYEEFKGTGNMEVHLSRELAQRRIFPAIDIEKSSTRKEELLFTREEMTCSYNIRNLVHTGALADSTENILTMIRKTATNKEFLEKLPDWLKLMDRKKPH